MKIKRVIIIGRKNLNLTDEEKRERHRLAVKKYRARLKEKAKSDPKAQKQVEKNSYNTELSRAANFLKKKIQKKDISYIRDVLAERQKELRLSKNKKV